ncbi:hypothetical protein NHQ30_009572 [Ciborinia camelliae]|nr:hypothetical protein NHQ30_009572 [Ciborinia camelliae]
MKEAKIGLYVDAATSWAEITNCFQNLNTDEDLDNEDEDEGPTSTADLIITYESEESIEMKLSLMIFYFFEDLYRFQDFLHGSWKSYKDGKIDLVSAGLITNSAFQVVRLNEQDMLATASSNDLTNLLLESSFGCFYPNGEGMGDLPMNSISAGPVDCSKTKPAVPATQPASQPDPDRIKQANMQGVQFPKTPKLTHMTKVHIRVPSGAFRLDGSIDPIWEAKVQAHARAEAGVDDEPYACDPEHQENGRKLDVRMIKPQSDNNFVFTHNPIYCEVIALRLVTADQADLFHCDYPTFITFLAHLYAESHITKLFESKWPAMDQMIDLHKGDMFLANVPQSCY